MRIAMSRTIYKSRTGLDGDPEKRGSKIRVIDNALDIYERHFAGATQANKIILTASLFKACKDWLQAKEGKSDQKKQFLRPTRPNMNLINRRTTLKELAEQCLVALSHLNPNMWAQNQFDAHKVRALAAGNRMQQARPLAAGYNLERESWLHSNKTRAIAGSGLESPSLLNNKKKQHLTDLNLADYLKIDQIASGGTVLYSTKVERLDMMVVLDNASLLCQAMTPTVPLSMAGRAFPTLNRITAEWFPRGGAQDDLWMYAMDSYGNLFTKKPQQTDNVFDTALRARGFNYFNHSSFNAGREIVSAGMIAIEGGVLRWIDNNSGHYKPGPDQIQKALRLLAADGADVSQAFASVCRFNDRGDLNGWFLYDGQDFADHGPHGATQVLLLA